MKKEKYHWWTERFHKTFELFDLLRIDLFRCFEAAWEIPADKETAIKGKCIKGPGKKFINSIQRALGVL